MPEINHIKRATVHNLFAAYRYDVLFGLFLQVVLFVNSILSVRILGLRGFGEYAVLGSLPVLLPIVIQRGNSEALVRFLPGIKNDPRAMQRIVLRVMLENILFFVPVSLLLLLFHDRIFKWLDLQQVSGAVLWILLSTIFFVVIQVPLQRYLRVALDNFFLNISLVVERCVVIVGFYLLFFLKLVSVKNLLLIAAVGHGVVALLLLCRFVFVNRKEICHRLAWSRMGVPGFYSYSHKMFVYSLLNYLASKRGAVYFIQIFIGPTAVAVFNLVEQLTDKGLSVVVPKSLNVMINIASIEVKDEHGNNGLHDFLYKYFVLNSIARFFFLVFLVANVRWIMNLYGVDIDEWEYFFVSYSLFFCALSLVDVQRKFVFLDRRVEFFAYIVIVNFLIALLLFSQCLQYGLYVIPFVFVLQIFVEFFICIIFFDDLKKFVIYHFSNIFELLFLLFSMLCFVLFFIFQGYNVVILNILSFFSFFCFLLLLYLISNAQTKSMMVNFFIRLKKFFIFS
ncbi:MAG: oligosaccharide flippase family protein [Thermodesulfobacteriota bacterium]